MTDETVQDKALTALEMRRKAADHLFLAFSHLREVQIIGNGNKLSGDQKELDKFWFFGYFYGNPGSKSLKALLCRHFIENMEIIVYNPCPVRVLLSSILNHHKRDARA